MFMWPLGALSEAVLDESSASMARLLVGLGSCRGMLFAWRSKACAYSSIQLSVYLSFYLFVSVFVYTWLFICLCSVWMFEAGSRSQSLWCIPTVLGRVVRTIIRNRLQAGHGGISACHCEERRNQTSEADENLKSHPIPPPKLGMRSGRSFACRLLQPHSDETTHPLSGLPSCRAVDLSRGLQLQQ